MDDSFEEFRVTDDCNTVIDSLSGVLPTDLAWLVSESSGDALLCFRCRHAIRNGDPIVYCPSTPKHHPLHRRCFQPYTGRTDKGDTICDFCEPTFCCECGREVVFSKSSEVWGATCDACDRGFHLHCPDGKYAIFCGSCEQDFHPDRCINHIIYQVCYCPNCSEPLDLDW